MGDGGVSERAEPTASARPVGLPGAVSVSVLRVYDWETDDGVHGGSPHFHTVSREGYVVIGGSGSVQTLGAEGSATTPLSRGDLVWFTPGTVHRLVNDGDLEIVTLMQNAGLPEAGDAVLTFPLEHLADAATYAAAHALPDDPAERPAAARTRRDLALRGYAELSAAVEDRGPAALVPYYERAAAIVRDRLPGWGDLWREGPLADAEETGRQLTALADGDVTHLTRAVLRAQRAEPDEAWGMCGRLTVWRTGA